MSLRSDPAEGAFAITKSDSTVFTYPTSGIYVGGTGDVNVVTINGETVLFESVPAGAILPIQATKVLSTSTSATKMVGLYTKSNGIPD